jgi:hypothetical protein
VYNRYKPRVLQQVTCADCGVVFLRRSQGVRKYCVECQVVRIKAREHGSDRRREVKSGVPVKS